MRGFSIACLVSLLASSLPNMLVWTLTFQMVMLWVEFLIVGMMRVIRSLSR